MKHSVSRTLYQYWDGLRGQRLAPRRFEIEPAAIAGVLPDTLILERSDARVCRFRLAGTRVVEAFGIEFRGVNFFDLFNDEDRITLHRQVALIARQGAVGRFEILAENGTGLNAEFEMILMPLTHVRDVIDRFLGCIAPVQRPAWVGSVPLRRIKLVACETIWPDGKPHGLQEDGRRQAPFGPHLTDSKVVRFHRRQFRVYEGGLSGRQDD